MLLCHDNISFYLTNISEGKSGKLQENHNKPWNNKLYPVVLNETALLKASWCNVKYIIVCFFIFTVVGLYDDYFYLSPQDPISFTEAHCFLPTAALSSLCTVNLFFYPQMAVHDDFMTFILFVTVSAKWKLCCIYLVDTESPFPIVYASFLPENWAVRLFS